eukprot:1532100-Rhodomonas_salina.1
MRLYLSSYPSPLLPLASSCHRAVRAAAALLAVAALAAVIVGTSQEERNDALLETNLHYYLGDKQALSAEDSRKQADSFFDTANKKQRLRHQVSMPGLRLAAKSATAMANSAVCTPREPPPPTHAPYFSQAVAKKKGMSDTAARQVRMGRARAAACAVC